MTRYFSNQDLNAFSRGLEDMHHRYADLQARFLRRTYKSDRAREFACHGFCRRLSYMVGAVDVVYEKLPPALEETPERDAVVEATIAIQSFVMNAFGCLDNLAWIWVSEKPVLDAGGKELDPMRVGLGPKCREVRASFSQEFVAHLNRRQEWVDKHLKGFRDSLAHRIPLYIPPFIIPADALDEYNDLERTSADAIRRRDFEAYDKLQDVQRRLGVWRPWMTHSVTERSPHAVFHAQLLSDYMTIDEFGREMLEEFER